MTLGGKSKDRDSYTFRGMGNKGFSEHSCLELLIFFLENDNNSYYFPIFRRDFEKTSLY